MAAIPTVSGRHHRPSVDDRHYFRVVVSVVDDGEERILMEGTGTGHHAAVGYFDGQNVVGSVAVQIPSKVNGDPARVWHPRQTRRGLSRRMARKREAPRAGARHMNGT